MLFHLSIEADDPQRMSPQFFAELWGGAAAAVPVGDARQLGRACRATTAAR